MFIFLNLFLLVLYSVSPINSKLSGTDPASEFWGSFSPSPTSSPSTPTLCAEHINPRKEGAQYR